MRSSAAARRYSKALFGIAKDEGSIAKIQSELDGLSTLFKDSTELRKALFRPLHPVRERRGLLRGICESGQVGTTLRNFLTYLIDQRRLVDFDAIHAEFSRLADEAAGRVQAEVVSASPLPETQRQRLQAALARQTGQDVDLVVKVDPDLIGGAVAKVAGIVFDGSLRTQLSQLRDTLTRGQ